MGAVALPPRYSTIETLAKSIGTLTNLQGDELGEGVVEAHVEPFGSGELNRVNVHRRSRSGADERRRTNRDCCVSAGWVPVLRYQAIGVVAQEDAPTSVPKVPFASISMRRLASRISIGMVSMKPKSRRCSTPRWKTAAARRALGLLSAKWMLADFSG